MNSFHYQHSSYTSTSDIPKPSENPLFIGTDSHVHTVYPKEYHTVYPLIYTQNIHTLDAFVIQVEDKTGMQIPKVNAFIAQCQ